MRSFLLSLTVVVLGCGGRGNTEAVTQPAQFALALPHRVVVHAGETTLVTLIAIGASDAVSFTVSGIPSFASVQENTIRVAPARGDTAGDSTISVTATDGARSDSGTFVLTLANAAPTGLPRITFSAAGLIFNDWPTPSPLESSDAPLAFPAPARSDAPADDPDGDPVELLVEFRPA